ncbi:MAG: transcriptional repressor LexA [Pirellulaceae bacterium]
MATALSALSFLAHRFAMASQLTTQQKYVYDYIRDKIVTRGYGPTVREIGEHMNIKSPNGVMCHLKALEKKGMIVRKANKSRAIELTEELNRADSVGLPLTGGIRNAVCFPPRADFEASGRDLDFADLLNSEKCGGVVVYDDSLVDVGIRKGDTLVTERRASATDGQLAIVRVPDSAGGFTHMVRLVVREDGHYKLQSANPAEPALVVDEVEVAGVVTGLIRRFA